VLAAMTDVFVGLEAKHGALVVSSKPKKRAASEPMLPPTISWAGDKGAYGGVVWSTVSERLRELFPHWYDRGGWRVGNETFGGCWCHSLPTALTSGPAAAAAWIDAEVATMLRALRGFAPHIERVEHWSERATRVLAAHEAVGHLVNVMVENDWLSESWYRFADDGVRWMLNAATVLPLSDPRIRDLASSSYAFTSWTGPSAAQQGGFADAVADVFERLG
jgi:hypothetical protein